MPNKLNSLPRELHSNYDSCDTITMVMLIRLFEISNQVLPKLDSSLIIPGVIICIFYLLKQMNERRFYVSSKIPALDCVILDTWLH